MKFDDLDLAILKTILSNKKNALEFAAECGEAVFSSELFRFGKFVNDYIKIYKDVPTRRTLIDTFAKSDSLIKYVGEVFDTLDTVTVNEKEYKHDLKRIKDRYANHLLVGLKDSVFAEDKLNGEIPKNIQAIQQTLERVKGLYKNKIYDQKTLKESIPEFKNRYIAKTKDPNFGKGIFTGYSFLDYQTNGLRPAELFIVAGESGSGKCHAKGQGVLKSNGSVIKVEDIQVGDYLLGPSGSRKVLSTTKGHDYMYDIVPVKGKPWRVNIDHILTLVDTRNGEVTDISVKNYLKLTPNHQRNLKLFRVPVDFNSSFKPRLDPYFLGVVLGDGSTTDNSIMITTADYEIKDYLHLIARSYNLNVVIRAQKGKAFSYSLSGIKGVKNPISEELKKLNLFKVNGGNKFIPFEYKTASVEIRKAILAGLIDTDGSYDGGGFDYISKSETLANDVAFIARSLGLAAYVKSCIKSCQTGKFGTYYRVSISGHLHMVPCKIARKQARLRMQCKDVLRTGFTVVPTNHTEDYYGFNLDGDARYLLDDFTVTHNSMMLMNMATQMWQQQNKLSTPVDDYKRGYNVLYFSLEMPYEQCLNRVVSRVSGVPYRGIRDGNLPNAETDKLSEGLGFIKKYPWEFEIVDIPRGASIENIEIIFNDARLRFQPDIVVVDYLGLMDYDGPEADDWLKLGKISEQLHEFARVYNVCVLTAVQLNRMAKAKGSTEEDKIGAHRIGRSALIIQNANVAMQIEKRAEEQMHPDMIVHLIKNRDGELVKGRLLKNFTCCALTNDYGVEGEEVANTDDISDKINKLSGI